MAAWDSVFLFPREERRSDADICGERLINIVEEALRVGGGKDGAAGLQLTHEACLGHADGLLLHGLVNARPVALNHGLFSSPIFYDLNMPGLLTNPAVFGINGYKIPVRLSNGVELIDAANSSIGQHEGAGLQVPLAAVPHRRHSQTRVRRPHARREHRARGELGSVPQQLQQHTYFYTRLNEIYPFGKLTCDFPVPGSPTRSKCGSPRTRVSPPSSMRSTPPHSATARASLTAYIPYICALQREDSKFGRI